MLRKLLIASAIASTALLSASAQAVVHPHGQASLDNVTFRDLPVPVNGGSVSIPDGPTIEWEAGQRPEEYLPLGSILSGLGVQDFTLDEIAGIVGLDPADILLSRFELTEWQTVQDLLNAVPQLENYKVADVGPIFDALEGQYADSLLVNLPQDALAQVIPEDILGSYTIRDIPNLGQAELSDFKDSGFSSIEGVPGLDQVPYGQFPVALEIPYWAKVDITYGDKETTRQNTITGSIQEGRWDVPCYQSCAYLELTNPVSFGANVELPAGASTGGDYHGKQFPAGDFQKVKGGWAVTESNWAGGYEPTGQQPFGDAFKLSIADVTEQKGTALMRMNFQYCQYVLGQKVACTPYGVVDGALSIPFLLVRETGFIPVMALTGAPSSGGDPSREDSAEVDTSDETVGETGSRNPVTNENEPNEGPSEQAANEPVESEVDECSYSEPLYKPVSGPVTSPYGIRVHPLRGTRDLHNGMDIGAPTGTVIGAAECGTVTFVGWKSNGSGNVITVDHGNGFSTQYAHLCPGCFFVKNGSQVDRGEPIGKVGETGGVTGAHLHWIVRVNGTPKDPATAI